MNIVLDCETAPPLAHWVQILVDRGWKLIDHTADEITAKKLIGQSEYPLKNATLWRLTLRELEGENAVLRVTIDVPAFTTSPFSRMRIYEEFTDIAEQTGDVQTKQDLEMDILENVRQ